MIYRLRLVLCFAVGVVGGMWLGDGNTGDWTNWLLAACGSLIGCWVGLWFSRRKP